MVDKFAASKVLGASVSRVWPEVFNPKLPVPLALGVRARIAAEFPDVPDRVLQSFLGFWTSRIAYLRVVAAPGSHRFDVDGKDVGEVSAEHREHAAARLADALKRRRERGRDSRLREHKSLKGKETAACASK